MRTKTSIIFLISITTFCLGLIKGFTHLLITSPSHHDHHTNLSKHLFFSIGSNMRNILGVTFGRVVVV